MKFVGLLPKTTDGRAIGAQRLRSGTSVAANFPAAGRLRSAAEFIVKLDRVEKEADETAFSLELIFEPKLLAETGVPPLRGETTGVVASTVVSRKAASTALGRWQTANPKCLEAL